MYFRYISYISHNLTLTRHTIKIYIVAFTNYNFNLMFFLIPLLLQHSIKTKIENHAKKTKWCAFMTSKFVVYINIENNNNYNCSKKNTCLHFMWNCLKYNYCSHC